MKKNQQNFEEVVSLDWVRIVFAIVVGVIIFLIAYSDLPLLMKTAMILGPLVTLVLVVFGSDILKKIFRVRQC